VRGLALEPAQRLRDRDVLLIEPVEAAIHLIEVAQRFSVVPVYLGLHLIEAAVHPVESPSHGAELLIDGVELLIDGLEAMPEKLDEILILARRHGGPLRGQTALDLVHSRLEVADAPAELGQVAIERIAPGALVGKDGLDAPQ
jgi:hypothetical protein